MVGSLSEIGGALGATLRDVLPIAAIVCGACLSGLSSLGQSPLSTLAISARMRNVPVFSLIEASAKVIWPV